MKCERCGRRLSVQERKYYHDVCGLCTGYEYTQFQTALEVDRLKEELERAISKLSDDRTKRELQEENLSLKYIVGYFRSTTKKCWCPENRPENACHTGVCQIAQRVMK